MDTTGHSGLTRTNPLEMEDGAIVPDGDELYLSIQSEFLYIRLLLRTKTTYLCNLQILNTTYSAGFKHISMKQLNGVSDLLKKFRPNFFYIIAICLKV